LHAKKCGLGPYHQQRRWVAETSAALLTRGLSLATGWLRGCGHLWVSRHAYAPELLGRHLTGPCISPLLLEATHRFAGGFLDAALLSFSARSLLFGPTSIPRGALP